MASPHCPCCFLAEQFLAKQNKFSWTREQLRRTLSVLHEDRRCKHTNQNLTDAYNEVVQLWKMTRQSSQHVTLHQVAPPPPPPPPGAPRQAWPQHAAVVPHVPPATPLSVSMSPPGVPLACYDVGRYEEMFGKCTLEFPYGERCWEALRDHIETYPYKHWVQQHALSFGSFNAPLNYSKKSAEQPMGPANRAGPHHYPCLVSTSTTPGWTIVVCNYMLFYGSRPWYVHSSWVVFYG